MNRKGIYFPDARPDPFADTPQALRWREGPRGQHVEIGRECHLSSRANAVAHDKERLVDELATLILVGDGEGGAVTDLEQPVVLLGRSDHIFDGDRLLDVQRHVGLQDNVLREHDAGSESRVEH
jgi:hypothetical protein